MKSTMNVPDWSNLQSELLELVVLKLHFNFVDVIRFGAVCKSWYAISLKKPLNLTPPQLPWLMLSCSDVTMSAPFRFFSMSDQRLYCRPPPPRPTTCCGFSNGWLFMTDINILCSLLNPLTKQQIILPCILKSFLQPEDRQEFINMFKEHMRILIPKAVLSSTPCEGCVVMAINMDVGGGNLVFCKVGGDAWEVVRNSNGSLSNQPYQDVIYFKDKFYAVDAYSRIVVCNLSRSSSPFIEQLKERSPSKPGKNYLVEFSGELLLITRILKERPGFIYYEHTIAFQLFREDPDNKEWIEVEDIGDHAIFLGHNHSISLLASKYYGCRSNCIYFTDDHCKSNPYIAPWYDCGIFNLANGLIEPLPGYSGPESMMDNPVWVTASPW